MQTMSDICTHAGCGVRDTHVDEVFSCPCHGSKSTPSGIEIQGPAPPLRAWLFEAAEFDADELRDRLVAAAATLGEAHARRADHRLLPTLDTIGRGARGAQFVALMPGLTTAPLPRPSDVGRHIARELARMIAADLVERRSELAQRVTHRGASPTPWDDVVAAAIADRVPPPPASMAPRG
jgi:hypothetical protein